MKQLTKEQAIAFAENKCYENMTYRQIAEFQMEQDKLCMPFGVFHEAMEKTLGRPVFTHEFAFREELRKELYGEKEQQIHRNRPYSERLLERHQQVQNPQTGGGKGTRP